MGMCNTSIFVQKLNEPDRSASSQKPVGNGYSNQNLQLQKLQQQQQQLLYQMLLQKQRQQAHQKLASPSSTPTLDPKGETTESAAESGSSNGYSKVGNPLTDIYTLNGMKALMKQKNLSIFTAGLDFSTAEFDSAPAEEMCSSFAGPFAHLAKKEPEPKFPPCYTIPCQPPISEMLKHFSDETLLYIFYTTPRDALQVTAAQMLRSREWKYHKEQQVWYHKAKDSEPLTKTSTYEKGSYVYMDISKWEEVRKDNIILEYDKLEHD
ncbi:uncharacterized protein LOC126318442 isoform X2 [Schistocerca gregaria]|uniref:uncharacterized protein LOC126318442 isoform X2 n=1 Tax=Schistocerca gregaria TaxID=7010 RepID=UPI00211EFB5A|nr:uncharacterized protein LOC126318442 isoform X2 [Schistocerca gregaria]